MLRYPHMNIYSLTILWAVAVIIMPVIFPVKQLDD